MKYDMTDYLQHGNAAVAGFDDSAMRDSHDAIEGVIRPTRETSACATVMARHNPLQNDLLGALPADDYERMLPHLEFAPLPLGRMVCRPGHPLAYAYFPIAGMVSRQYVMEDGSAGASAITGREGLVGIPVLLGGESPFVQMIVQGAGHAYRLKVEILRAEFERGGALQNLLLRYAHALLTQMGRSAVCNGHHSIEQRLCRWLLLSLDRMSSNYLTMTQQRLADFIGVRRESIALSEKNLCRVGVMRSHRGQLVVRERAELEARVCECYQAEQTEFGRLLPARGNAPGARARAAACLHLVRQ